MRFKNAKEAVKAARRDAKAYTARHGCADRAEAGRVRRESVKAATIEERFYWLEYGALVKAI